MRQVATILIEQDDGGTEKHSREFGGFKQDLEKRSARSCCRRSTASFRRATC